MRTLQTLRESCIDTNDNNDFIVYDSIQFGPYMDIKAFKLSNQLSSGFYYLSGMIVFNYDKTNFTFPHSKVHNKITMTYSEPMVDDFSNQVVSVIDVSNSYLPIDANNIAIVIERQVFIKPNSGGFKLSFMAVEFDGTEEQVATTGGGSDGFSQSFNLVELDDSFFWMILQFKILILTLVVLNIISNKQNYVILPLMLVKMVQILQHWHNLQHGYQMDFQMIQFLLVFSKRQQLIHVI